MATDWTRAKELLAGAQSRRQSYVSVPELDLKVLIRRWPKIDDDQQALVVQYLDAYTDPKNGEGAVTLKVTEPQAGKKPYPGDWYLVSNRGADPKNAQDAPGVVQTLVQYSDDLTLTTRKDGEVVVTEQTKAFPTRGLAAAWLATIFTNPITGAIKQGSLHQAENGWVVQLGTQTPQAWDTADVVYHDLWGDTTFRAWGNQTKGFSDARKTSLAAGLQNGFQARLDAATGLWSGSYVITQPTGGGGGTPWHTCEQTGIITGMVQFTTIDGVRKRRLNMITAGFKQTSSLSAAKTFILGQQDGDIKEINGGRHFQAYYANVTYGVPSTKIAGWGGADFTAGWNDDT